MITSDQFDQALELELERLVQGRIERYVETEEFYQRLDQETQKELDQMRPFFGCRNRGGRMTLILSPPKSESKRELDLELILEDELDENEPGELEFFLERLEKMAAALRDRLFRNAGGQKCLI